MSELQKFRQELQARRLEHQVQMAAIRQRTREAIERSRELLTHE